MTSQKGSAHVIIIIVLVVALLGALGFIFWQNFIASKDANQEVIQEQVIENTESSGESAKNEDYLVLEDWGVKFELPEMASEIVYYKEKMNDGTEYYEFTTKRVEDLGGTCVEPNDQGYVTRLGSIARSTMKAEEHWGMLVNQEPLNGYYYFVNSAQSLCADESPAIQMEDRKLIDNMLMKLVVVE